MYKLRAYDRAIIMSNAKLTPDAETCGIIAGGAVVTIKNIADDPSHTFAMSIVDVLEAIGLHGTLEAVWHTHPSGSTVPSLHDLANQPAGIPMIIGTTQEVEVHGG